MSKPEKIELSAPGKRRLDVDFSAGLVSSDGGALLLREADHRLGLSEQLAACFTDYRRADLIDHTVQELVAQRTIGLALGYEDLDDHDELAKDPLLATVVGKKDITGENRKQCRDQALASSSTLGRMERTKEDANSDSRYEKIVVDFDAVEQVFLEAFIRSFLVVPERVVVDLDPSDVPLYGAQEDRFFHGYYQQYCYLPMYVYCGEYPLSVQMRPSNIDGAKGSNPRFVVTSLPAKEFEKRYLYEDLYCARGEMENRIKEVQLDLFGDRASCHTFRGNALRLWFAMAAQLLAVTIRRVGLVDTELEKAQAKTLRTKLFKIGALVTVSVRRIYVRLSSAFPRRKLLVLALSRLRAPALAT